MKTKSQALKPASSITDTVEALAKVIEDPNTPEGVSFRMKEEISIEMKRIFDRIDTWNPAVIRKLYPMMLELETNIARG